MPTVTFITESGENHVLTAMTGTTLMQLAVDNGLEEIAAECGGAGSCATCHCYIAEDCLEKVAPAEPGEVDMLECVMHPQANSRLSCQITLTDAMDGLVVKLPESQF